MNLIARILAEDPHATSYEVTQAMMKMDDPKEIRKFYQDYVDWVRVNGGTDEIREDPEKLVQENIGWALMSFPQEDVDVWLETLPGISDYFAKTDLAFYMRAGIVVAERTLQNF